MCRFYLKYFSIRCIFFSETQEKVYVFMRYIVDLLLLIFFNRFVFTVIEHLDSSI